MERRVSEKPTEKNKGISSELQRKGENTREWLWSFITVFSI